jgi:hypothetical protein
MLLFEEQALVEAPLFSNLPHMVDEMTASSTLLLPSHLPFHRYET